jgi:hypothetical protein
MVLIRYAAQDITVEIYSTLWEAQVGIWAVHCMTSGAAECRIVWGAL